MIKMSLKVWLVKVIAPVPLPTPELEEIVVVF
jgi:hypothetical protein